MARKDNIIVGLDMPSVSNILTAICTANEAGYLRYYVPVAHPRYKREFTDRVIIESHGDNFSRSIVALYPQDYVASVVGKISDYINVDSEDTNLRKNSELVLEQEVKWCMYLGISTIMLAFPVEGAFANLARALYSKLKTGHSSTTFLLRLPMVSTKCQSNGYRSDETVTNDSWSRWNAFRTYCAVDRKLKIALEIPTDLPSSEEIDRWLGEPIGCAIIKCKTFLTNPKGFPVLTKLHQELVNKLLDRQIQIVISGATKEETRPFYQQYIDYLWKKLQKNDMFSEYVQGYEDYLQIPLQPLMDNLDRYTYEIFEKDPVKYREYQRAIRCALTDRKTDDPNQNPIVVMVVGAGRGPLVNAALEASLEVDMKIKLYAIEKNPHAMVSLQAQKLERWKDDVTIVSIDMRKWKAPERADIVVSELLGSFGDNELSPECLDGAQKFLKDDGISIPCSYSSYVCPTQTHKIYAEISDFIDRDKPVYQRFEQPYVVHLQTVYQIAPVQKLFTFIHPNKDEPIDNTRYKKIAFTAEQDSVIHGFSGFFDTVLYKDVTLSIVPETYSQGMFSWFPIFFPIKDPIQVKKGEKIEIAIWRLSNEKIVWYEWLISSPIGSFVHNPNGRSYFIGLT